MTSHVQVKVLLLFLLTLHNSECYIGGSVEQDDYEDAHMTHITDVTHQILMNKVGPHLNTTYLSRTDEDIKNKYNAIIWGFHKRLMVAMPARIHQSQCSIQTSIVFKIDTGCPITMLSKKAIKALFKNCPNIKPTFRQSYFIDIAGEQIHVTKSINHYKDLNILGADFLRITGARVKVNYSGLWYALGSGTVEFDVQRQESQEL